MHGPEFGKAGSVVLTVLCSNYTKNGPHMSYNLYYASVILIMPSLSNATSVDIVVATDVHHVSQDPYIVLSQMI